MFKIERLIMTSVGDEHYTYKFASGINYFRGKNDSGKTEFYKFLDYMFGSSEMINEQPWFKDSLKKASIEMTYDEIQYVLTRTMYPDVNYFCYKDEPSEQIINLDEYKDKLNSIFTKNEQLLRHIRNFTEENLTYRSFTMFNFLGETRQGVLNDFFDKCSRVEYSVKLNPILNFVFNNNLERIFELKKELEGLQKELEDLEQRSQRFDFICQHINLQLNKLNAKIVYNGRNADDVKEVIKQIKDMEDDNKPVKNKPISELAAMYNSINEQIKIYENTIADGKRMEVESRNREALLTNLKQLIADKAEFQYLIQPLVELLDDLDKNISFSKYIISDNTIKELRNQRLLVKNEIANNDYRFRCFSITEKAKYIAIVEEYLGIDIVYSEDELKEKRKRIRDIKEEIRILQNSDDTSKINALSKAITDLYVSTKEVSDVVKEDTNKTGFRIQYYKRGNILQPMITTDEGDNNFYTGSMARHTLIQLCGYLCFLDLLLSEQRYPIIPIIVVDHISKPFDETNRNTIGVVFRNAYKEIGRQNLQTFIFDDEAYESLSILPDYYDDLVSDIKTGFNPFFKQN